MSGCNADKQKTPYITITPNYMYRIITAIITMLALAVPLKAAPVTGGEKAISEGQLPAAARQTISAHFAGRKIALAKMETELFSKTYSVIFTNGEKIEFDGHGRWTEIKCKRTAVPATLIPPQITRYIRANYPECKILEIEKDDGETEVTLSNHIEVTFNRKYEAIDIE